MEKGDFIRRSGELIERMQARAIGLHVPGQGAYASKTRLTQAGVIELKDELLTRLDGLCDQIPVGKLIRLN